MSKTNISFFGTIDKHNFLYKILGLVSIVGICQVLAFYLNSFYNVHFFTVLCNLIAIYCTYLFVKSRYEGMNKEMDELNKVNATLNELHNRLIQKNEQLQLQEKDIKKEFENNAKLLSIISHDVKAPLLSVKNILEFTKNDHTNSQVAVFLPEIRKTITNTIQLLENLLEWSRSKNGHLNQTNEVVHFNTNIHNVVDLYSVSIKSKNILVEQSLESNLFVYFDKEMLQTVLRNIISNAVKYTEENGTIKMKAFAEKDKVIFEIANTAFCVNDEQINYLNCSKDLAVKSLQNEVGSGIGLMLVKDFVEKNNAQIKYLKMEDKFINCRVSFRKHHNQVLRAISYKGETEYLKAID